MVQLQPRSQSTRTPLYSELDSTSIDRLPTMYDLPSEDPEEPGLPLDRPRVWIPELELGLGLWQGENQGITRAWLRWYDRTGNWVPTPEEQERQEQERERQAKELAQQKADRFAQQLRAMGIDPDQITLDSLDADDTD